MKTSVLVVVVVSIAVYYAYNVWTRALDVVVDTSYFDNPTGHLVKLRHGDVHYKWHTPPTQSPPHEHLVVMIHGIASSGEIMKWAAADVAAQGYTVLTYDIYGRGHSDVIMHVKHDAHFYMDQLNDLLEVLGKKDSKFTLVGYSMGGAISAAYTAHYPNRVKNLVLIAAAGMPFKLPWIANFALLPHVGEFLVSMGWVKQYLLRRSRNVLPASHFSTEQYVLAQTLAAYHAYKKEGFYQAMLSTVRDFPLNNCTEYFSLIGQRASPPVLLVWGDKDETTPYEGHTELLKLVPHTEFISVPNASHNSVVLIEREITHSSIIKFLEKNDNLYQ